MKKYFQTKRFLVTIILILLIVIFSMLFNFFSKERLFKKDLECSQNVKSVERYRNEASASFYSTKRNSCIYIVSYSKGIEVYDLFDRTSKIKSYSCSVPTVCYNESPDTFMNCRNIHKEEYDKADSKCNIEKVEFIEKIKTQYR